MKLSYENNISNMCNSYEVFYSQCKHFRVQVRACPAVEHARSTPGAGLSRMRLCQGWQGRRDPQEPVRRVEYLCLECHEELEKRLATAARDTRAERREREEGNSEKDRGRGTQAEIEGRGEQGR